MKKEPFYTVGGNVNWYSHYEKPYEVSLRKRWNYHMTLKFCYRTYTPRKPWKDTYTPMLTELLFTIARMWKPPKGRLLKFKTMCILSKSPHSASRGLKGKDIWKKDTLWSFLSFIKIINCFSHLWFLLCGSFTIYDRR